VSDIICNDCTRANKSCPAWPSHNDHCIEKEPKDKQQCTVVKLRGSAIEDRECVPAAELFSDVINPSYPLKNCNSSAWHHMQCGCCSQWWAIEGPLLQSLYNCPHCAAVNEKGEKP